MPRPSFSLGAGGIENTSCDYNVAWVSDAGLNPFSIAFPDNQCGDLQFQDQTRTVDVSWVPQSGVFPSADNIWQTKERRLVGQDSMFVLFQEYVPADAQASASLTVVLPSSEADAVSLRLFIYPGFLATTPAQFDAGTDEAAVQYWRHIDAPVLDSVIASSQSTVRIVWQNRNPGRSFDQTQIFRDGRQWPRPSAPRTRSPTPRSPLAFTATSSGT